MTTPSAIAPGANSFATALGRGDHFSSKGTAKGPASDLASSMANSTGENVSKSSNSGSGDDSTFHSVLNDLYASQDSSPKQNGGLVSKEAHGTTAKGKEAAADKEEAKDTKSAQGSRSGDKQSQDASGLTSATMILPLAHDGTHSRSAFFIPSTNAASQGEATEGNDSQAAADTSAPVPPSLQPASTTASVGPLPISTSNTAISSPDAGKAKTTATERVGTPGSSPSVTDAKLAAAPAEQQPVDDNSFPSVLNQVSAIESTQSNPDTAVPVSGTSTQTNDGKPAADVSLPKAEAAPRSIPLPPAVSAKADPQPVKKDEASAPRDVTSSTTAIPAPIVAEPQPVPVDTSKGTEISSQPQSSAAQPPIEWNTTPANPVQTGDVAFAARLTPNEDSPSAMTASAAASDNSSASDESSVAQPVVPMNEADVMPSAGVKPSARSTIEFLPISAPPSTLQQRESESSASGPQGPDTGTSGTPPPSERFTVEAGAPDQTAPALSQVAQIPGRETTESHPTSDNTPVKIQPKSTVAPALSAAAADSTDVRADAIQSPERPIVQSFAAMSSLPDPGTAKSPDSEIPVKPASDAVEFTSAGPQFTEPKGQSAPPATGKAIAESSQPASESSPTVERGRQAPNIEQAEQSAKPELSPSMMPPAVPAPAITAATAPRVSSPNNPAANPSPAARMQQVLEMPAVPQSSSRDITVRVPDATERGMDVRFVERGGEVRVVRTVGR